MSNSLVEFVDGPKDGDEEWLSPGTYLWGEPNGSEIGLYRREIIRGREIMKWWPGVTLDEGMTDLRLGGSPDSD